ncbi:hypothetical protein GCM10010246_03520 [Streptomyces cuspidosporus]|uniref:Uncharacterized protein n=1 Tax=Streptomyces cuspidosporus TaxID=66882 RepID=A0ABN3FAI0_9ACTN
MIHGGSVPASGHFTRSDIDPAGPRPAYKITTYGRSTREQCSHLVLTWAPTGDATRWERFASGLTGQGLPAGIAVVDWTPPLLWTAGYVALPHDRRRLARPAVLPAALISPSLAPPADSLPIHTVVQPLPPP